MFYNVFTTLKYMGNISNWYGSVIKRQASQATSDYDWLQLRLGTTLDIKVYCFLWLHR